jgi:PadR family transcriptional regulator PadR
VTKPQVENVDIVSTAVYTYRMTDEIREPTFLVLAALAGGRRHGYGIIQEVDRLSEGGTHLRAGTLYAMLDAIHARVIDAGRRIA